MTVQSQSKQGEQDGQSYVPPRTRNSRRHHLITPVPWGKDPHAPRRTLCGLSTVGLTYWSSAELAYGPWGTHFPICGRCKRVYMARPKLGEGRA